MWPWLWWFVVLAGTMLIGAGLRTLFTIERSQRTGSTNLIMIGELVAGGIIAVFALWRIINSGHAIPIEEKDEKLRITE